MNFQTAAIVAGAAFLLSFLAGLIGGVPFLDILLRAALWAGIGFGASLGLETLLRTLLPDLFAPPEEPEEQEERPQGQAVNITLDEESPRGVFVEDAESAPEPASPAPVREPAPEPAEAQGDEEMPEIGSFLDAFKAGSPAGSEDEAAAPDVGEYSPGTYVSPAPAEVTIDGEAQDPAILAKAVQTVLKRDQQGN